MVVACQVLIDSCGALAEEGPPCGFLLLPEFLAGCLACLQLVVSSQLTRLRLSFPVEAHLTYLFGLLVFVFRRDFGDFN